MPDHRVGGGAAAPTAGSASTAIRCSTLSFDVVVTCCFSGLRRFTSRQQDKGCGHFVGDLMNQCSGVPQSDGEAAIGNVDRLWLREA